MIPGNNGALTSEQVASQLAHEMRPLGIVPIDEDLVDGPEPPIAELRRRRGTRYDDAIGVLTLLEADGVLYWEDGFVATGAPGLRRGRRGRGLDAEVVLQLKYPKPLGMSAVARQLTTLDERLTRKERTTLLAWKADGTSQAADEVPAAGRVLLLVHGTFSNSQKLVDNLRTTELGRKLFAAALSEYDAVLSFDHHTLSHSAYVNSIELARYFARSRAEVDVVCHSRGGLVARWWAEYLDHPDRYRRVVLVGCPLNGTSLADPSSLREGLNLLTNVGRVLGTAATLVPFLQVAGGLMQVVTSVTGVAARTPLVDAAIAMIPGLASMSRIENNFELLALNGATGSRRTQVYAVLSDFQPKAAGWEFWRLFNAFGTANAALDRLVFKEQNDLVVDTSSMVHQVFGPGPSVDDERICYFSPDEAVHHTSYFQQERTVRFIGEKLGLVV